MISDLFTRIAYKFNRLGFYFYSVKYYYQDNSGSQNKIKCLFKGIIDNLKIFNYKYGYYEYLEIPITTMCSLRCKNCSNLIPYYKNPCDYDIDIILKSIKEFFKCINNIVYIRVLGGEPFLSKNLYRIVKTLVDSKKVQRVEIVTNGTIVPSDKRVINIMKNKKVIVSISEYPFVRYNKLVELLEDNNINYKIDKMSFWNNYGNTKKRNKSEMELIKQFKKCNHICKSLINGQLHICPRSSHGTDLGVIKDNEDDYLDLLDKNLSISEKKDRLNILLRKKYIVACDYCDFATKKGIKIPVAEQLVPKKRNKKKS